MELFYGVRENRKAFSEFVYIPCNLHAFGYNSGNKPASIYRINVHPDSLDKTARAVNSGLITKEKLKERGWEIYKIKITDAYAKRIQDLCFNEKTKKGLEEKLKEILKQIIGCIDEFFETPLEDLEEDLNNRCGYYEDYTDDWWKRGEDDAY